MGMRTRRRGFVGRKGLWALLLTLGAFGTACFAFRPSTTSIAANAKTVSDEVAPAAKVTVIPVRVAPVLRKGIDATSTLQAAEDVILQAKVSGRLQEMKVTQGQKVVKGQVVAILDHRDQDAQVNAMNASIATAKAQLAQAKAELDSARREKIRYERLLKEGFAKQQELDARVTAWESAQAAYTAAQAAIRQNEANLQAQEVARSEYTLTAPIDGVVLNDYSLTPGTMISVSTPIAEIARVSEMKAVIQLSEEQTARVSEGMMALVTGDGFKGREVRGTIFRIRPFVDTSTRTVQVEVRIDNEAQRNALKPGMFAKVFIIEREAKNALVIPSDALAEKSVFILRDGVARRVPVNIGIMTSDLVEVLSGVASGDLLIVSGGNGLKDGDPVTAEMGEKKE